MSFDSPAPFPKTGTTPAIFVAREADPLFINPGEYFWMNVHSAQAVFRGQIWDQPKQLVITSKVNLHHPVLGNEEVFAIQRSRKINRNRAEQLGLSPNLISLVPATMSRVSVSIDFLLDVQNNLAILGGLINDDKFLAAVSLAPGAVAIAKTIGGLAQSLIQTFIPAQDRKPVLEFVGDFNISGNAAQSGLRSGYYIILGSRDDQNPLPNTPFNLTVVADGPLLDGAPVTQYSYVVLNVERVPARTRKLNEGAAWDVKLREAEQVATEIAQDPFASDDDKREIWTKCRTLLQEARALLAVDANYAPEEAAQIYKTVYETCANLLRGGDAGQAKAFGSKLAVDTPADRALLGMDSEENLELAASQYRHKASEAEQILVAHGLLKPEPNKPGTPGG